METAVHDTSGSEGFSLRWTGWFCDGVAPAHVPQLCWLIIIIIYFFLPLFIYLFLSPGLCDDQPNKGK